MMLGSTGKFKSIMTEQTRKEYPIFRGCFKMFPLALAEVAHHSAKAGAKYNDDGTVAWDRSQSVDELDALLRHLYDFTEENKREHLCAVVWRALAMLQKFIEIEENGTTGDDTADAWVFDACDNYFDDTKTFERAAINHIVETDVNGWIKEDFGPGFKAPEKATPASRLKENWRDEDLCQCLDTANEPSLHKAMRDFNNADPRDNKAKLKEHYAKFYNRVPNKIATLLKQRFEFNYACSEDVPEDFQRAVECGFVWEDTPESYDYWEMVAHLI